jgi:2'-5' RNA ligase
MALTNIKIIPSKTTMENISTLLHKYNLPDNDFIAVPHCTIIYSPDVVPANKIPVNISLPILVKDSKLTLFDTKDDGIVLVIEFTNSDLLKYFRFLKDTFQFTTKYDEYRPHITIAKNVNKKFTDLPKINFDLVFDKIEIETE